MRRRAEIATETVDKLAQTWNDIFVSAAGSAQNQRLVGRNLAEIAEERDSKPVDALIDLLIEERGRVNMISFNQSQDNLRKLITHPLCNVISDGFYVDGRPHPRLWGTFPLLLGTVRRDWQWLTLPEAVHKVTAKTAERFGMAGRGRLAPGYYEDIAVSDAQAVEGPATYEAPETPPRGIHRVFRQGVRWPAKRSYAAFRWANRSATPVRSTMVRVTFYRARPGHRDPALRRRGVFSFAQAPPNFTVDLYPVLQKAGCQTCHNPDGVASGTRIHFPEEDAPARRVEAFGKSLVELVDRRIPKNRCC